MPEDFDLLFCSSL